MEILRFVYCNAVGELSRRELTKWAEVGHYIKGFSAGSAALRTFRKDRISEYLDGAADRLDIPYSSPPPRPVKDQAPDLRPQILFTGFGSVLRADLEAQSIAAGLRVCKTVTQNLCYLCTGPNAGPVKVEKSRAQRVYIVNEVQLRLLLETGELPDME